MIGLQASSAAVAVTEKDEIMTGTRFCISALVILALVSTRLTQSDKEKPKPWQQDWQEFGKAIAPFTKRGASWWEINRVFERRTIEWTGRVKTMDDKRNVVVAMEPIEIPFPNGVSIKVSELPLYPHVSEWPKWSAVTPGGKVVFRSQLLNRTHGILPVVRFHRWADDESPVIQIDTYGAELLRTLPDKQNPIKTIPPS